MKRLVKGSKAAKDFMAKIRAKKVPKDASISTYVRDRKIYNQLLSDYDKYSGLYEDATESKRKILKVKLNKIESALSKYERKKISGWTKGSTRFIEKGEKPLQGKKNIKVQRRVVNKPKGAFFNFSKVISGLFDTKTINDLDGLKQEYRKLALIYHPDKGGSTAQFQELQAEYEKLRNKILSGSTLSEAEQENEIVIDDAIRAAINAIITLDEINIELIGKWVWVSGKTPYATYPLRTILSAAGYEYIKKAGVSYWVYKGVESKSRGGTDMADIKKKYGSKIIKPPGSSGKKLNGVKTTLTTTQKNKFKSALSKLTKAINKRPL
jgi:hypothetical protein